MEENEISTEITAQEDMGDTEIAEEAKADEAPDAAEAPEECCDEAAAEAATDSEPEEISTESFAKTLANPMFAVFARGRSGGIEEAVRDFEKMLLLCRSALTEEELMKMTPGAHGALGATALSERQRRIARDAGMSYREYYEIIRSIPTKK
jgi:hypothetical protein